MLQLERQMKILNLLHTREAVIIVDLSEAFKVSRNTIRRDLKTLAAQGLVEVTHGGAVLIKKLQMGAPLSEREISSITEKRAIGQKAAEIISEGEAIILDAGTTTEQIARALRNKQNLTILTNAVNIAQELSNAPGITVVLIGGIMNDVTKCLAGFHAEQFVSQFHAAKAFISAGGVTPKRVTNTNAFEVQIKRSMMAAAEETYLVVTHHKIGRTSLAPFARIEDFDVLLTDRDVESSALEPYERKGVRIILC